MKIVPEPRAQEYLKYLAVLVDKNLTWKYHFDAIAAKISKTIGLISKLHTSSNILLKLIIQRRRR